MADRAATSAVYPIQSATKVIARWLTTIRPGCGELHTRTAEMGMRANWGE